jgi:hypothetical protein
MTGVGAAFFLAGTKRQALAWPGRHGFAWLFRICTESRRLWRRYAYIVPGFLCLATVDFLRRALRRPSTLELRTPLGADPDGPVFGRGSSPDAAAHPTSVAGCLPSGSRRRFGARPAHQ